MTVFKMSKIYYNSQNIFHKHIIHNMHFYKAKKYISDSVLNYDFPYKRKYYWIYNSNQELSSNNAEIVDLYSWIRITKNALSLFLKCSSLE